jgi:hypothetical protein
MEYINWKPSGACYDFLCPAEAEARWFQPESPLGHCSLVVRGPLSFLMSPSTPVARASAQAGRYKTRQLLGFLAPYNVQWVALSSQVGIWHKEQS